MVEIDAPPPEPVSITITDEGQPQAGVTVYFQNPDSTVVATEETDSTGTATAVLYEGGYVTAVNPYVVTAGLPANFLRTFGGVKPGDHLLLNNAPPPSSFQITLDGPTASGLTRFYQVTTSCGTAENIVVPLGGTGDKSAHGDLTLHNCGATTDIQIVSFNTGGEATGSIYVADKAVSPGATVQVTGPFASVPTRTYTLTNVPTTVSEFHITDTLASTKGTLAILADDATGAGTGTSTMSMKMPTFTNASSMVEAVASFNRNKHTLLEWGPYSETYTRDAGAWVLKGFASDPTYSEATHAVTWTETPDGVSPDFVHLIASGRRPTQFNIQWEMVAPYTEGTARLPTLPTEHADLNLLESDQIEWSVRQYKVTGGFDAVRAGYFVLPQTAGTTGALSKVQWQPPIQP